jgi:RNA polymerase sigma-70 factor (ECF subfamily)
VTTPRSINNMSTTGTEFAEVLVAAQSGAEWAIAVLWGALHGPLLRFLRGLDPGAAEDLESETWLRVARDLTRFEGSESDFRAWVFAIARHRLIDWRRRVHRRPAAPVPVEELAALPGSDDPAEAAEEALQMEAAVALIRTLPRDQAEVILLRVVAGLDARRVAAIVGKRPGTVRVLQHRGLQRLAQRLAELGTRPAEERVTR